MISRIIIVQINADIFLEVILDSLSWTGRIKYARIKAEINAMIYGFIMKNEMIKKMATITTGAYCFITSFFIFMIGEDS